MSLKIFHVVFISLSVLLCLGFGYWAIEFSAQSGQGGWRLAGGMAGLLAVALLMYGWNFLNKMKGIS